MNETTTSNNAGAIETLNIAGITNERLMTITKPIASKLDNKSTTIATRVKRNKILETARATAFFLKSISLEKNECSQKQKNRSYENFSSKL